MLMGTFCRFSDCFCAVTTTSSSALDSGSVAAYAAGVPARIAEMAEASGNLRSTWSWPRISAATLGRLRPLVDFTMYPAPLSFIDRLDLHVNPFRKIWYRRIRFQNRTQCFFQG